jgi:hypothetical protein
MKELTEKQMKIAAIGAIVLAIVCIVVVFLITARAKKMRDAQAAEERALNNAAAVATGSSLPKATEQPQPGVTDKILAGIGSIFTESKPRQDVMNTDPTYVFASRLNDSIEGAWLSGNKTQLWNDLAGKSDEFVKHVVNWYNGQFGGGKTLRQNLEGEWTGDSSALLQKLSKLGL